MHTDPANGKSREPGRPGAGPVHRALGLMSGTSLDGIDVAMIETDGASALRRGPSRTYPYDRAFRQALGRGLAEARTITDRAERPGSLAELERDLTVRHADAVAHFLAEIGCERSAVDLVGFHGQTVLHRPEQRLTVQLGCGALLADLVGLPVVYDLRAADCAAGGQGAPLVPVYHRALAGRLPERPVAVLNIGGVANVTFIGRRGELIAFDTGPGSALIDDWMARRTGRSFDEDGATALAGSVHEDVVRFYLSDPFFAARPPKSLDRNAFVWDLVEGLSPADGAATLAALTAGAVAKARWHMPEEPGLWVVCGGGRRNRAIMTRLAGLVENAVVPAEAAGLDGDAIEAEAWAYLAVRSVLGLPITFSGTTGVAAAMTGGVLVRPGEGRGAGQ